MEVDLQLADRDARRWDPNPRMALGPARTSAIVDTGSEMTVIDPDIVGQLFLNPIRHVSLRVVGSADRAVPVFAVRLAIGMAGVRAAPIELSVVSARVRGGANCILGRDVLDRGGLAWYGDTSRFQLVLPA